jgi:hypothetical protein
VANSVAFFESIVGSGFDEDGLLREFCESDDHDEICGECGERISNMDAYIAHTVGHRLDREMMG